MSEGSFYESLGRWTYSFNRIDFIISNLAVELEIVPSYDQFYSRTNFAKKIRDIKHQGSAKLKGVKERKQFLDLMDQLEQLRTTRNDFTHSIILVNSSDDNDLRLFNFVNTGAGVERKITSYTRSQLKEINDAAVSIHNKLALLEKLKKITVLILRSSYSI